MNWTIETFGRVVDDELRALPVDIVARLTRYLKEVEQHGPVALPAKAVKHLDGPLWEFRVTGRDGIGRVIYMTAIERRVVLLRAFIKKTDPSARSRCGASTSETGMMTRYMDLHEEWMQDPAYAREYEALDEEFSLAKALIKARVEAGLSRDELAARIKMRESAVARLEGGSSLPSTQTLRRIAEATGTRLRISFDPAPARSDVTPTAGRSS